MTSGFFPGILEQRLTAIGQWGDAVSHLADVLDTNRDRLQSSYFSAETAADEVVGQAAAADSLRKTLDGTVELALHDRSESVTGLKALVGQLVRKLQKASESCGQLKGTLDEIAEDLTVAKDHAQQAYGQVVTLDSDLARMVGELAGLVTTSVETATLSASQSNRQEAWQELDVQSAPITRKLLAQYVDLLGGISIRERGITMTGRQVSDLCNYAVELASGELSSCFQTRRRVLMSIPARDASLTFDQLPIMGLGVGQWSLWGLPLIAHEFGLMTVEQPLLKWLNGYNRKVRTMLRGARNSRPEPNSGLLTLAGDAIGAWTLGPAYAAALIYLELNPCNGFSLQKGLFDTDRAIMLRVVLDKLAAAQGAGSGLDQRIITPLFDGWERALVEAGTQVPLSSRVEVIKDIANSLLAYLSLKNGFTPSQFGVAEKIADLAVGKPAWDGQEHSLDAARQRVKEPDVGLRHVLNAGWLARLGGQPTTDAEDWMAKLADTRIEASKNMSLRSGTVSDASAAKPPQRQPEGRAS